jgi:outer membrane lipoprotein-sorting protein
VARALLTGLLLGALAGAPWAAASDARQAVEAFVARLGGARVSDLTLRQSLVLYDPSGRHTRSTGEQLLFFKSPARQRVEVTIEGRREVRLVAGGRAWVRDAEGRIFETPHDRDTAASRLPAAFTGTAADLLAEWQALGIRTDVSHQTRYRGRTVTVVGAGSEERDRPAVWFDQEYGVLRIVTRERVPGVAGGNGAPRLVDRTFSDHRPLAGGFHLPYRWEVFVDGHLLVLITVRSASVNTGLPDALFDPDALRRER